METFFRYWPLVRGIHRPPVNSLHKGQWRGALMLSLICAWINVWVNNREAGDLRRQGAHYDVTVMCLDGFHYIPNDSIFMLKCLHKEWLNIHIYESIPTTQWYHMGVATHRQLDCLFNSLYRLTSLIFKNILKKGNAKARNAGPFRGILRWPLVTNGQ